jgi:hypothetical protein
MEELVEGRVGQLEALLLGQRLTGRRRPQPAQLGEVEPGEAPDVGLHPQRVRVLLVPVERFRRRLRALAQRSVDQLVEQLESGSGGFHGDLSFPRELKMECDRNRESLTSSFRKVPSKKGGGPQSANEVLYVPSEPPLEPL